MLIWLAVQGILFFVQPHQVTISLVLGALAGVGLATCYLIPWSMLADVVDVDELHSGQRREGICYGLAVFLQKFGIALGLFLMGALLDWQGFNEQLPAGAQPESALLALRWLLGPIPAVLVLLGMLLTWYYPITRQKHATIRAQLAARATGAASLE
jgi:GPH family glycoside/pentoside/hexuronide:cation symporter